MLYFTDEELLQSSKPVKRTALNSRNLYPAVLRKIREAICAFANNLPRHQEPGLVFVGVRDDKLLQVYRSRMSCSCGG